MWSLEEQQKCTVAYSLLKFLINHMHDKHYAELWKVPENEFIEFPLSAVLATHGKCDSHYASDRVLEPNTVPLCFNSLLQTRKL